MERMKYEENYEQLETLRGLFTPSGLGLAVAEWWCKVRKGLPPCGWGDAQEANLGTRMCSCQGSLEYYEGVDQG